MVRNPLENKIWKNTDTKPRFNHGHNGIIIPCCKSYIWFQMIISENVGDNNILILFYKALAQLKIPYERVETDEAVTMDDCVLIDQKLNMKMVKTLFLCNRKKTIFYLFITAGRKVFDTKHFSSALGISRVSFAPAEMMEEMLGNKIGAATVFGTLLDQDRDVQVIIDKEAADEEFYGCSDGTTTCYMKIRTEDIIERFLPFAKHKPVIVDI